MNKIQSTTLPKATNLPAVVADPRVSPPAAESAKTSEPRLAPLPIANVARDDGTTARSGGSPFAALVRSGTAPALPTRRLCESRGLDEVLELSPSVLERAAALEIELAPERVDAFARVREGFMLVATDAQLTEGRALGAAEEGARSLARTVAERGAGFTAADAETGMEAHAERFRGVDIHAFVQYVLRESYLLQSEILYDYAQKVRHYNELKKATRERLEEMRQVHTAWSVRDNQLGSDVTYFADEPVPYMVLGSNGQWFQDLMSEDDVNNYVEQVKDSAEGEALGGVDARVIPMWDELITPSNPLQDSDIETLEAMANEDDDYIRDHLDQLLALVPRMSAADLKQYLRPILDQMWGGNPDEKEMLDVYAAMSPAQFMHMIALGYEEQKLRLGGDEKTDFLLMARQKAGALAEALGSSLDAFDNFDDVRHTDASDKTKAKAYEIKGNEAASILSALQAAAERAARARDEAEINANENGPEVGDPKVIRTAEEMENYIKNLEEQLNAIGDDAQLANVDLQNALQRQQQTLQMMSNISKTLHDTAMAIIRKIGS